MDAKKIKAFAEKLSSLEAEWEELKKGVEKSFADLHAELAKAEKPSDKLEPKKRSVVTEQNGNFPYPVGKIVQVAFPALFKRKLINAGDLAYLLSPQAAKDFHIKGTFTVLVLHTTDNDSKLYRQGICRYYKDILLELGSKKYHLTNQFRPNSRADVLKWITSRGLKRQELIEMMGKSKGTNTSVPRIPTSQPVGCSSRT